MAIRISSRLAALSTVAALLALTLLAGTTSAAGAKTKTKPVNLRVVTSSGTTLADYVQYTGGKTAVKADDRATCFGETNPSSNKRYTISGANALSVLIDAKDRDPALAPLRITDAFFDDFGSFGVCRIGDFSFSNETGSYWYNANEYVGAAAGPNQIPAKSGDHVLWYLTTGNEPFTGPSELELRAPVRAKTGTDVTVKVVRHFSDGTTEPAAGAVVGNSDGFVPTDSSGEAELTAGEEGTLRLKAIGGSDDVPSGAESVCVGEKLNDCPAHRGKTIFGSPEGDHITGTKGRDKIGASDGADTIDVRSGGADKVTCGSGKDTVIRARNQAGLDLTGCEKVKRRS